MEITPELSRLIGLVAEAKMRLMVAAAARATADFGHNFEAFERCTKAARAAFDVFSAGHDGKGPLHLYAELRACELGVDKLRVR